MQLVTPKQKRLIDELAKFMDLLDVKALTKSRFNYVRDAHLRLSVTLNEARNEANFLTPPDKTTGLVVQIAQMQIDENSPHAADDAIDTLRSLIDQAKEITHAR